MAVVASANTTVAQNNNRIADVSVGVIAEATPPLDDTGGVEESEGELILNEEDAHNRRQQTQAKKYGEEESEIVPFLTADIVSVERITIINGMQNHKRGAEVEEEAIGTGVVVNSLVTIPVLPQNFRIVTLVHAGMLSELRKSVSTRNQLNSQEEQGRAKRRRIVDDDPIELTSNRLCSDLVVSTPFYKNFLSVLPVTFGISIDKEFNIYDKESARRLFIRKFCVCMKEKYGGNNVEEYLVALESLEFVQQ